jgi:HD-GYP domain-containing protein (c-di-GMP phosphodiesterase class II)
MLVAVILVLLFKATEFYRAGEVARSKRSVANRSKFNLVFTIISTLVMMAFLVIFNMRNYYDASVTAVIEDGENRVKMTAAELENYLTVAESTLRVAADSVSYMEQNGASSKDILMYLTDQTNKQFKQFDENFTGIYAYVNGDYMDGSGWIPPEGYDPVSRDWYKVAVTAGGEVVIVSPYVDAQTGQVIITIAKSLSPSRNPMKQGEYNVVCLDVIVNHIKEVTEQVAIAGKGYGMVVNNDGFIIAHRDEENNGKNLLDMHGQALLNKFMEIREGTFEGTLDKKKCTFFVSSILDQWYDVIVVNNDEFFEDVRSQLMINIMVSVITVALISFFYFLGYKNEQDYGKKVEDMNIHVVSALATAIDAKDTYTNGHSSRVAKYSRMIARRIGYGSTEQDEIYMMGLLHDVGKIGVPDEVINKTSRLTDEEFELIRKHPVIGSDILKRIKERPELSVGARWHHERYDGKGYPDGLSGEEIPEEARIIAVADAYDAMTSRRSYRGVMPQENVRKEIEEGMGTQFDPRFARVMIEMIDEDTDYQMREK